MFLSFSRIFCDYQGDFFKNQGQFKDKLHFFRIPGDNSRTNCTFLEFQEFSRTKVIFKDFSRSVRTLSQLLPGSATGECLLSDSAFCSIPNTGVQPKKGYAVIKLKCKQQHFTVIHDCMLFCCFCCCFSFFLHAFTLVHSNGLFSWRLSVLSKTWNFRHNSSTII